jgi:Spy/CpxP family protein refolding chaperone
MRNVIGALGVLALCAGLAAAEKRDPPAAPPGAPPGGPRPGFVAPQPGQILPAFIQEYLKLTADQKKQVEELQKEVDAKLAKILTEEQNKTLKDMRDRFGRPGSGPGGFPPGGFPGGPGGFPGGFPPGGFGPSQPGQLLPPPLQERLKLSDEQKKEVEELQKDLDAKVKEAEAKLAKILTEEQNKRLKEMRGQGGRPPFPVGPPGGPGGGLGGGPPVGLGGPPSIGQILPGFLQTQLKLTADQKKEVEALQKEVDGKLAKILTEEQNKRLKEMRERFGRPGGGFPGGPGLPSREERRDRPPSQ